MGGLSKISLLSTSSSGVALMRSVTISVQWPKISSNLFFFWPSGSLPPSFSLWKAYLVTETNSQARLISYLPSIDQVGASSAEFMHKARAWIPGSACSMTRIQDLHARDHKVRGDVPLHFTVANIAGHKVLSIAEENSVAYCVDVRGSEIRNASVAGILTVCWLSEAQQPGSDLHLLFEFKYRAQSSRWSLFSS